MSIRSKIVLFFTLMICAIVTAVFVLSQTFILRSFDHLQSVIVQRNVLRATDALNNQVGQLNTKLSDWTNWDETYHFVVTHNKQYVTTNLTNASLVNLKLNYMLFYNSNAQLVEAKGVSLPSGKDLAASPGLLAAIQANTAMLHQSDDSDGIKGVMESPEGLVLVAARPILDSNGNGPSHGTMLFIQYLQPQVASLASLTHLSLDFYPYQDTTAPVDVKSLETQLVSTPILTQTLSSQRVAGYGLVDDIQNKPVLIIRVLQAREVRAEGARALKYFMFYFGIATALGCVAALLVLDMFIVRRITRLSQEVAAIGVVTDNLSQVTVRGNDELTKLGNTINSMLKRLYDSRFLEERNQRLSEKVAETTEALEQERLNLRTQLAEAQRINNLMINRELKMIELKKRLAKYEPVTVPGEEPEPKPHKRKK